MLRSEKLNVPPGTWHVSLPEGPRKRGGLMEQKTNNPEALTSYLEQNPSVKELLAQYQQAKEMIRDASEAMALDPSLYLFYICSSNL
jgi:hypothetical protein